MTRSPIDRTVERPTEHIEPRAEVPLTLDSPDLVQRFTWPGPFDSGSRLMIDTALQRWTDRQMRVLLAACRC